MKIKKHFSRGFTLLEMLVVIGIIAVLVGFGATSYNTAQKKARDAKRKADVAAIANALEVVFAKNGSYSITTSASTCYSGTFWDFNSSTWGKSGSGSGCPASVGNGLAAYMSGSIPEDPYCVGATCKTGWLDYGIEQSGGDGSSFSVYTQLEYAPTTPCTYGATTYNYCVESKQ